MTREEILQTFSDINHAYNNSTKYDTLKRMLDELTEPCEDCISRADARHLIAEVNRKKLGCISTKAFKTLYNGIDELPPVQPKPKTDVLDKIRAEIEQEYSKFRDMSDKWSERANGLGTALEIIDKYKAESEDKE